MRKIKAGLPQGGDSDKLETDTYVMANGTTYFGDVVSADGFFSHGSEGLDPEFCTPGHVVTLVFTSSDAAAFETTYVYEYVVQAGDNDLGQIEIGLHGFSLTGPADGATVGPDPWPPQFQWTAYARTGITPQYSLYLLCDIFTSFMITTAATSVTLKGDETITNLFGTV